MRGRDLGWCNIVQPNIAVKLLYRGTTVVPTQIAPFQASHERDAFICQCNSPEEVGQNNWIWQNSCGASPRASNRCPRLYNCCTAVRCPLGELPMCVRLWTPMCVSPRWRGQLMRSFPSIVWEKRAANPDWARKRRCLGYPMTDIDAARRETYGCAPMDSPPACPRASWWVFFCLVFAAARKNR